MRAQNASPLAPVFGKGAFPESLPDLQQALSNFQKTVEKHMPKAAAVGACAQPARAAVRAAAGAVPAKRSLEPSEVEGCPPPGG